MNNVADRSHLMAQAAPLLEREILTRVIDAEALDKEVFSFFRLSDHDFPSPWLHYNARGPLTALYTCTTEYLLYTTGDVYLSRPISWVEKAIWVMECHPEVKVANLTWNGRFGEAKRESFRSSWNFYWSRDGFSDQMFLVRTSDFRAPIFGEIRDDSAHFPRGPVWERRAFSYMKNRGWVRITYRRGSYIHHNVENHGHFLQGES